MKSVTPKGMERLTVMPTLPPGYTYGNLRFTKSGLAGVGVRRELLHNGHVFAEIQTHMYFDIRTDDVVLQYAVRATNYTTAKERPFNNPHPWIEYPDIETLVSAVLARHRLGAWYGH